MSFYIVGSVYENNILWLSISQDRSMATPEGKPLSEKDMSHYIDYVELYRISFNVKDGQLQKEAVVTETEIIALRNLVVNHYDLAASLTTKECPCLLPCSTSQHYRSMCQDAYEFFTPGYIEIGRRIWPSSGRVLYLSKSEEVLYRDYIRMFDLAFVFDNGDNACRCVTFETTPDHLSAIDAFLYTHGMLGALASSAAVPRQLTEEVQKEDVKALYTFYAPAYHRLTYLLATHTR